MFKSGLIAFLIFVIIQEIYLFRVLRSHIKSKILLFGLFAISFAVLTNLVYNFMTFDRTVGQTPHMMWSVGFFLLNFVPRIILIVSNLIEDFYRLAIGLTNKIRRKKTAQQTYMPSRRKFVFHSALGLAAIPFLGILHGVTFGKYNYKVIRERLRFRHLPKSFEGFKILQITDIHSGSLDNQEKIEGVIELINQQQVDVILFTGDIVNNFHWEMDPWISVFKKIKKAPYGNYAVLGNHDYGEYSEWKSEAEKQDNFAKIKEIFPKIGFELLLNEHRILEKEGEKIALIGIENWGARFIQKGDLTLASKGVPLEMFKILMSHDPSHWELEVKDHALRYDLTLSGHTHGTQFGIEVPRIGLKWSPAQFVYKQWAGFYKHQERIINVNRGFGYHFFPGRVGIWPEITVIELGTLSEN